MDIPTFHMILKSLHLDPSDYAVHEAINEASSGLVIEEKDLSKFLEILDRNQKVNFYFFNLKGHFSKRQFFFKLLFFFNRMLKI